MVEPLLRRVEMWWGLNELVATVVVGVVVGCVAFATASLLVVLFRGSVTKAGRACAHALLGPSAALDPESGRAEKAASEPPCAAQKDASKSADVGAEDSDGKGEERVDDGEACPEGGYRSDSASDDDGALERVAKKAQRHSRKAGRF